jgi:uncharacterized protein DUF4258
MTPPRIVFTRHAQEMLIERRLQRPWIELTITKPDSVESDPNRPNVVRAYRQVPERGGLWLRVVYESVGDTAKVITAFFDRSRNR